MNYLEITHPKSNITRATVWEIGEDGCKSIADIVESTNAAAVAEYVEQHFGEIQTRDEHEAGRVALEQAQQDDALRHFVENL